MPLTIGSNALSLRAQRAFSAATEGVSAATRRIGSGLRINSSADDAAGLAVAEGLNISTRVFSQGAKNINDALSMINIANGSLQQLSGIVTRQTELAEQAANGVYSATQRKALNQEAAALTNEYNRIIATTKFNGISLYPPSGTSDIRIQMGFGLSASVALSFGEKLSRDIGNGTFASPVTVASPAGTRTDSGDMNGDIVPDILLVQGAGSVGLIRSGGDGTYSSVTSLAVYGAMQSIGNGDFNGDGYSDILTTGSGTTNLLLANADGTFRAPISTSTLADSSGITVGDLNKDGHLDYIVGQGGTATSIGVYLGNGDGTFQGIRSTATAASPSNIKIGDFNNDSVLDLVVTETGNSSISIHLGNGNGTFKARTQTALGNVAFETTPGDVNNDGNVDLVALMYGNNKMYVLMGSGNGSFSAPISYQLGTGPNSGTLSDINNDGFLDSISTNLSGASFSVALGNGDGTFKLHTTYATGASPRATLRDFNDDGVNDVSVSGAGVVSIFHGNSQKTPYVKEVDLTTVLSSRHALKTLGKNLARITAEIGAVGAFEERLRVSLSNLETARDNYIGAYSRIRDADIAVEMASLTKENVRQQVASAILSQANQHPSLALSLLQ